MSEQQGRRARLLLVEDDAAARTLLRKILSLRGDYEIEVAADGREALQQARESRPDLIISDYMMPEMDGLELLQAVKADESLGNPIFMMLSAISESERKAQGLDLGADEYLGKPPIPEELVAKVNAFLRIKRLQDQLKEDKAALEALNARLEQSFLDLVRLVSRLIDLHVPGALDRGTRTAQAAAWIAERLAVPLQDRRNLEIAALLREIGKIGLPEGLARKNTFDLEPEEWLVFARHPVLAELSTSDIERLKGPSIILRHQLENFDGTGYPDHLAGDEIPLPSRILRCITGYEDFRASMRTGQPHLEAVATMAETHPGVFDPKVVQIIAEYLTNTENPEWLADKRSVSVDELIEGMTLASDLITSSGIKLLPAGTRLTDRMTERIRRHHETDPIVAGIVVKRE